MITKDIIVDGKVIGHTVINEDIEVITIKHADPKPIFAIYLTEEECQQIRAIWTKRGILGSVVEKIRSSASTKKIKGF